MAMLPVMEHTLFFENEFMLADNFGELSTSEASSEFVAVDHPFKVNFTFILLCTQGRLRVRLNLQEFMLRADCVLVVLPGSIGECLEISDDCQVAMIAYSGSRYEEVYTSFSVQFRRYLSRQSVLAVSSEEMAESLAIYHAMRRKVEQPDFAFTREVLNAYMQVLSCNGYQWLTRYVRQNGQERAESRQQQLFGHFLELVQKHYRAERGVAFYANKMCLTPKYLSLAIHQASGRFAGDWIRDYVILEAKALLKSRSYTVQQISEMLNFANSSFFGKYFKAATGCSPRRYMLE